MIDEAIILAGGLGTRLRSVVSDIPKVMAEIAGKPFLEYLLLHISRYSVNKVILSVGYKYEYIKDYFGDHFNTIDLIYSIEDEPLGTGGGIKKSLHYCESNEIFLLNGDTFFNINLTDLSQFHHDTSSGLSLSLKKMEDFDRYGNVSFKNNRIESFESKKYCKTGFINGGVYIIPKTIFDARIFKDKFSFESDFLELFTHQIKMGSYLSDEYFIDIGIPEDYQKSQIELPGYFV